METLTIIGSILVILGIVGSILPALPGPALSYIGLVLLFFAKPEAVSLWSLIIFGLTMIVIIVINYAAPILGAKFSGASRKGLAGAIVGCLLGVVFFPPLGIFIGAFLGAFLGELIGGKEMGKALIAGLGTLFGSLFVIILQTAYAVILAVYFFLKLFG